MPGSPLTLHHKELGAILSPDQVPLRYGSVDDEYWAARKRAGILDLSHHGLLSVTGRDRLSFLNGLLTNDIASLKENQGVKACLLTPKARVLAYLNVHNLSDQVLIDTGDSPASRLKETLDRFVITEDVKFEESNEHYFLLSIQGPKSAETIGRLMRTDVAGLKPLENHLVGPNNIIHDDRTGQGGYDIISPGNEVEPLWQAFLLDGVTPVGTDALEILRIEAGIPKYGVDVNEDTLILEAGLKDTISFSKGCYMGQEVVARATFIGRVNRRLAQLVAESSRPIQASSAKLSDNQGKDVGTVTSAAYSLALSHTIGLGYVGRDFAREGTRLEIVTVEGRASATVTRLV